MFTHNDFWRGIETMAKTNNISLSKMAKMADLDPTCLNKSKRFTRYGQPRWLSTENFFKVLAVTDTNLSEFENMIGFGSKSRR